MPNRWANSKVVLNSEFREFEGKMLRKIIVTIIGKKYYVNHVIFISRLYLSFLPFKNRANKIIKQYLIPCDGTVFDIGANIGRFTSLAASLVKKSGNVHSFEPVNISFRVLYAEKICAINI